MRLLDFAFALALGLFSTLPSHAMERPCRQALALGLDVSGSVDHGEYRLQIEGLAAALTHPDVSRALLSAPSAPVRLAIYEWSGPTSQAVIVDWTEIVDPVDLGTVVSRLEAHRRKPTDPSTALGTALLVGGRMLARQPSCWSHTLDISGDGGSNTGPNPQDVRRLPELGDITVNALVIGPEAIGAPGGVGGLIGYFERYVIHGPGAFAEHAADFAAYETAMVRKLLRELQGLVVGQAR